MFKKISAIVAAAAVAAVITAFLPGVAPEVQANTTPAVDQSKSRSVVVSPLAIESVTVGTNDQDSAKQKPLSYARDRKIGCKQAWPYYEGSCLHERNQSVDNVRIVRVIAMGRSAYDPFRQSQH